jgi:DNA-binding protein HU-beta
LIARIAENAGVSKKLATELIRVLPEVVEAGLERDGEVKVPGLGTFRLKWVETRFARNLKTGEVVGVPAHNKVVLLPERSLKDHVNGDFRYLTYQVLDRESEPPVILVTPKREKELQTPPVEEPKDIVEVVKEIIQQSETGNQKSEEAEPVYPEPTYPWLPETPEDSEEEPVEEPEVRKRKLIYWIIPLLFVIIALLVVVFYMKNCQDQLVYPEKEKQSEQQVIQPSQPVSEPQSAVTQDTTPARPADTMAAVTPQQEPTKQVPPKEGPAPAIAGFAEQKVQVTGGKYLFQLAREVYGNPYLWSLIYKENKDKITDPQQVLTGLTLVVPSLEGTPDHLARNDSLRVAEGYRMLCDYYTAIGDERAKEYRWAVNKYSPK